jgi:hypothetical protein
MCAIDVGHYVVARDSYGKCFLAQITKKVDQTVTVAYEGFDAKFNETIPDNASRIYSVAGRTRKSDYMLAGDRLRTRSEIQQWATTKVGYGDMVDVMMPLAWMSEGDSTTRWCSGKVVDQTEDAVTVEITGSMCDRIIILRKSPIMRMLPHGAVTFADASSHEFPY